MELSLIVDLTRYPLDRLETQEGRECIERCRAELQERGVCELEGFLREEAISECLSLATKLMHEGKGWRSDRMHNVYFTTPPTEDEASDGAGSEVARLMQHSSKIALAYDLLPRELALRVLYEHPAMLAFVAAALDQRVVFRSEDPLDALEIAIYEQGQELGWHFDNSAFSVTLMFQPAEGGPDSGGQFEYFPALRSHDDERFEDVLACLSDAAACTSTRTTPIRLNPNAGTLSLFQGRLAMHRVAQVRGKQSRINAVLTYSNLEGMRLTDMTRELFYGRLE